MKPWEKYQEMEVSRSPKETGPWDKYAGSGENRGLIGAALDGLEKYGSAPLRAAYGQVQDSMLKRGIPIDVLGAAKAAYDQFGDDPAKAPTAAQLVEQNPLGSVLNKQGFKENFATHPTAVGLRGLMAPFTGWDRSGEIVGEVPRVAAETLVAGETDPLSYVPGAVFEKPIAKGFELGGKALAGTGKLGAYLAENTTGIPREVWSNYAKRAKEIGKMAKDYVGESRYMNAYTDFRNQVGEAIAGRKNQLNETIDQGLSGASRGSKISITPIIEELDASMRGLHPVTEKAAIDEIQALKNKVRELAPEGKMSPWDAYKLQRFFHDRSMKAFAEGGQLFNPSSQAARAAKSARYKTTEMVNQFFPDTIKKANQQFVSLHNIDDMIPPSMLDPNGSAAALRRAALDPNSKERKALTQLSQFLHGDDRLVQQAMDLSTFEKMTNLPINPLSGGGTTSTSRTLLGGGVGLLGEASDDPEAKWLARGAGAMIASPALLKMGLDAGLMAPNAAKRLASKGGLLEKGVEKINPTMRALEKRLEGAGGKAKEFIKDEEGSFSPEDLLNILKPGEENVFDLKKARGLVGEPKRGLLEPKDNPVAKYRPPLSREERADLLNWIDSAYDSLRRGEKFKPVDEQYLREVLPVAPDYQKKYVKDLLATIEKQKVGGAEEVASALGGRPEFPESVSAAQNFKPGQIIKSQNGKTWEVLDASSPDGILKLKNPNGDIVHTPASDVLKFYESTNKSQPRGLLTSLDVERGPVKELPEAGLIRPKAKGMPVASVDNDLAQAKAKYNEMTALRDKGAFNDPEFDKSYGEQYQKDAPRIKAVRYGTPDGNQFVTRVELKNGKTFVGIGPDRKSATESAFNGGIEHLKSDPTDLLKNEKQSEMIVGSNNYIRRKLPFFLLQQNDVHILRHGDHFGALAIPRVEGRDPLYVMGKTIDEALQNLTPFAHTPDGEVIEKTVNPQLTNWLQRWSYQQPKVSLKDALDESARAATAVKGGVDTNTMLNKRMKRLNDTLETVEPGSQRANNIQKEIDAISDMQKPKAVKPKGGKVPKEKAPTFPKDSKFQKNQEVTYDGRPAKVVQYDGNGVYTVKVGNSHQQVHMSELKSGKGKPKKKK